VVDNGSCTTWLRDAAGCVLSATILLLVLLSMLRARTALQRGL
jgi:hypothetical protein